MSPTPHRRCLVAWALAFVLLTVAAMPARAAPSIVVSVKPLHGLVAAVTEGVAEPRLLVPGGASPHAYALRPSDARALSTADVVVWVGPALELFLAKPLGSLAADATLITAAATDDVTTLPTRRGGIWGDGDDDGDGGDGGIDPHVWLDPGNAAALARQIAATLSDMDPGNRAAYRANADRLTARISALDAEIDGTLAAVRNVPYVVFHDAYQYFERRYGLAAVGAVSAGPQHGVGARRLRRIADEIRRRGARCLFSEPQFAPDLVATVAAESGVRTAVLDPLGIDVAPGPDAYFSIMRGLAGALRGCLAAPL